MSQPICVSCGKPFIKNPRQKNQQYCSTPKCQRVRKNKWQREKMQTSPNYRKDQKLATRDWHDKNPDYWKQYRKKNPQIRLRNSLLQRKRNIKRKFHQTVQNRTLKNPAQKVIAKMDVLKSNDNAVFTECWIVPLIAKMDVLKGYLSVNYEKAVLKMDQFANCKDGLDRYVR